MLIRAVVSTFVGSRSSCFPGALLGSSQTSMLGSLSAKAIDNDVYIHRDVKMGEPRQPRTRFSETGMRLRHFWRMTWVAFFAHGNLFNSIITIMRFISIL